MLVRSSDVVQWSSVYPLAVAVSSGRSGVISWLSEINVRLM